MDNDIADEPRLQQWQHDALRARCDRVHAVRHVCLKRREVVRLVREPSRIMIDAQQPALHRDIAHHLIIRGQVGPQRPGSIRSARRIPRGVHGLQDDFGAGILREDVIDHRQPIRVRLRYGELRRAVGVKERVIHRELDEHRVRGVGEDFDGELRDSLGGIFPAQTAVHERHRAGVITRQPCLHLPNPRPTSGEAGAIDDNLPRSPGRQITDQLRRTAGRNEDEKQDEPR